MKIEYNWTCQRCRRNRTDTWSDTIWAKALVHLFCPACGYISGQLAAEIQYYQART